MRKSALLIRFMLCLSLLIVLGGTPLSVGISTAQASATDSSSIDQLLPLVGSALVDAGQQKWTDAKQELDTFATAWQTIDTSTASTEAGAVNTALTDAQTALAGASSDPKAATSALGTLARAVNTYAEASQTKASGTTTDNNGPSQQGLTAVKVILPLADTTIQHIDERNWQAAQDSYKQIVNSWPDVENAIRADNFTVYSQLEIKMSMIRVALQADPPREEQAKADTQALIKLLNEYAAGDIADTAPASGTVRLSDAVTLLQQVQTATTAQDQSKASDLMTQFISMWPLVEGEVQISSASTYTSIENEMAEVQGYLVSNPPVWTQASTVIQTMLDELTPLTSKTSYTAWDAAIILLREGLEAILVLAALLAYAKRSGSRTAGQYIWSGAISGLVLSGVMAVIFVYAFSQVSSSGSTREMIEGITGLVAVVMMLSVGHWLHQKANLKNWNTYIENQVSGALERGSLWSLAIVSGLAILREGAETAIFYIGMAPAIALSQFILGIAIALVILIVIAVLIIKFSVKLPIRPFFLTATVLIYYLVFRFLGESIHALQVAGKFPAHTVAELPSISWIGMYPIWETFIPQMIVLIWMVWRLILPEYRSRKQTA